MTLTASRCHLFPTQVLDGIIKVGIQTPNSTFSCMHSISGVFLLVVLANRPHAECHTQRGGLLRISFGWPLFNMDPTPPYMGVGKPLVQVSIFLDIMCEFQTSKSPTLSFFGQIFGVRVK